MLDSSYSQMYSVIYLFELIELFYQAGTEADEEDDDDDRARRQRKAASRKPLSGTEGYV
jgi:hypothetical protein